MASLLKRLREKVDRLATGTDVPAGQEPPDPSVRPKPTARERTAIRRRLRELRRRREAMLIELGALTLEQHRQERSTPELVTPRAEELEALQGEIDALESALAEDRRVVDLVAAGIAGSCPRCGTLASTSARYCDRCGAELASDVAAIADTSEPAAPEAGTKHTVAQPKADL
jgi:hypothetical protein